jgi:hypothetical protein
MAPWANTNCHAVARLFEELTNGQGSFLLCLTFALKAHRAVPFGVCTEAE